MTAAELSIREGTVADLSATFELSERAMHAVAVRQGVVPEDVPLTDARIRADWVRQRSLIEFLAAQPDGRYVICEGDDGPLGYARAVRFGGMEQITELMVSPDHQGHGIGRALMEQCWPGDPSPDLGRIVVAAGAPNDLTLYTEFGVMPIGGHWHMRVRAEDYRFHRSQETDAPIPEVHVLKPGTNETSALCWVSSEGEIGPAIGAAAGDLVPVVLAALDRVAQTREPETLSVYVTTLSWWLIRRLRKLGFQVFWPSWIMCSIPLPGLDRYVPTRPPHVL